MCKKKRNLEKQRYMLRIQQECSCKRVGCKFIHSDDTKPKEPPLHTPKPRRSRRSFVSVSGNKKNYSGNFRNPHILFTSTITIHKLRSSIFIDSPKCSYNVIQRKLKIPIPYNDFCEKYLLLCDLLELDLRGTLKSMAQFQDQLSPKSIIPILETIDPTITLIYLRLCQIESKREHNSH